jgi:hypothetical protein
MAAEFGSLFGRRRKPIKNEIIDKSGGNKTNNGIPDDAKWFINIVLILKKIKPGMRSLKIGILAVNSWPYNSVVIKGAKIQERSETIEQVIATRNAIFSDACERFNGQVSLQSLGNSTVAIVTGIIYRISNRPCATERYPI